MQKDNLRSLAITTALGAGNNTLVEGGQLGVGIGSIRVWQLELAASAAETITPFSNTTAIPGELVFAGPLLPSTLKLEATGTPWMECLPGQSLIWNLANGATLTGTLWYSLA
jgi:hypothetical protein